MAKITAEFDTKDKTLMVSMDGKKMKKIASAEFFVWGDEANASLTTIDTDDDESVRTITRIMASENGDVVKTEQVVENSLEAAASEMLRTR